MRVRMAERVTTASIATRVLVLPATPERTATTVSILCICNVPTLVLLETQMNKLKTVTLVEMSG